MRSACQGERPPAAARHRGQGVQFSASGVSWSSCVAERASWLARNRTASEILRGSASVSGETRAGGPIERLNARVDDEQRDLDAAGAQLERGRSGDRTY